MIPPPKDSGIRENFSTGSRRDTRKGKGRYDLLPTRALELLAIHFENGSVKYGDRNWEKGQPLSRYLDSALRHLFKHLQGLRDEPHAVAAAWNLLCLIDTERRIQDGLLPRHLNDLPLPVLLIEEVRLNDDPNVQKLRAKLTAEEQQAPKLRRKRYELSDPCTCGGPGYLDNSNGRRVCGQSLSSAARSELLPI